jgi:polyphenol oxidase
MSMPMETITEETTLARAGFAWREQGKLRALVCSALEHEGFTNGFSTRIGGTSPMPHDALNLAGFQDDRSENIHENRRRFLSLFEGAWTLAACWQVHEATVREVQNHADARCDTERCDALITDHANLMLAVKTADCVPVLLADKRTGAIAAIHAGWRGTLAQIVEKTLKQMMQRYGTRAEDVCAAIGPSAAACCYEVGAEVVQAFRQNFKDADELLTLTERAGHARIDLPRANRNQLVSSGVEPARIHIAPLCTICRNDLFFSYRREKHVQGRVGRSLSVIGKRI